MGVLSAIDRIVSNLAGDGFPDDPTERVDWLCSREEPSPEDRARAMDFATHGYRNAYESPHELWAAIHSGEAAHGRSAHDFVARYELGNIAAGQNVDLDFVIEQHNLATERAAFEQQQAEASAQFEARARAAERASTFRQQVARQRARLAELKSLSGQIDAEKAACLEGLRELFDPGTTRHESVSDLRQIIGLNETILACDAAAKALPNLVKLAESRLAAFEKSFPTQ